MTAAWACVWSGVLTVTASICLPISSSILRKSLYFLACGNWDALPPRVLSSMSHRATMLPYLAAWSQSLPPLPPTPTQAMLRRSMGAWLSAIVRPPAAQKPTPARVVCLRKSRRWVRRVMTHSPLLLRERTRRGIPESRNASDLRTSLPMRMPIRNYFLFRRLCPQDGVAAPAHGFHRAKKVSHQWSELIGLLGDKIEAAPGTQQAPAALDEQPGDGGVGVIGRVGQDHVETGSRQGLSPTGGDHAEV